MTKRSNGVQIEGSIYAKKGDLGVNEFIDAFIDFIESKGWSFGGGPTQIDEKGNKIDAIDS